MKFDYSNLRSLIVKQFGTLSNFCEENKINPSQLSTKLNNHGGFSQKEIIKYQQILGFEDYEISDYFFQVSVQDKRK